MFTFPVSHFSAGGAAGSLPSSVCLDLDATDILSWNTGDEDWKNLIASPPVGSQAEYDFWLGVATGSSTDDPTHVGTPGNSAAYWLLDGGDFFTQKDDANTMLATLQQTSGVNSGPAWIAIAGRFVIDTTQVMWGSADGSIAEGVRLLFLNTETGRFTQAKGSSGGFNEAITPADTLTAIDTVIIVTFDSTNTGSEKWWYNSSTGQNWDTAYSPGTTSTNAASNFVIGASPGAGFPLPNLSRIYSFLTGNSIITDSEVADMLLLLNDRHDALSV